MHNYHIINSKYIFVTFSLHSDIYPTKKETHHYDFPIKISLLYENVNCHEIFISDQILLKLECDVDEYLYLSFVSTKHIKANGKRVFEALFQRYSLHGIRACFTFAKYENDTLSLCETTNVFIDAVFVIPK